MARRETCTVTWVLDLPILLEGHEHTEGTRCQSPAYWAARADCRAFMVVVCAPADVWGNLKPWDLTGRLLGVWEVGWVETSVFHLAWDVVTLTGPG